MLSYIYKWCRSSAITNI